VACRALASFFSAAVLIAILLATFECNQSILPGREGGGVASTAAHMYSPWNVIQKFKIENFARSEFEIFFWILLQFQIPWNSVINCHSHRIPAVQY
jgi:hypothetical protein